MTLRTRSIAMLAANSAFASILSRALEDDRGYRVPSFATAAALTTFMRISPVDIVVLDAELEGPAATDIARGLRDHPRLANPAFSLIVLTRTAKAFHRPFLVAGADIVLQKPVAPAQLLECIDGLLFPQRQRATASFGAAAPVLDQLVDAAPAIQQRYDNVIPLFGEGRKPR